MDKLLPCPFCGGEVSIALCGDGFDEWWFITRGHGKNACKCRLFMESEKFNNDSEMADFIADDLIAAWNRRAQPENKPLTCDAVPVVRGEWIEKTYIHEYANEETEERQYVVCGICGKQPPSGFGAVNFCHNCGADMRRESEVKE